LLYFTSHQTVFHIWNQLDLLYFIDHWLLESHL